MWISKKKLKELEKRIADLEVQVQSQQKVTSSTIVIDSRQIQKSKGKSVF